jgi:predicted DNA-binding protein (MmcQ/YjbR family)
MTEFVKATLAAKPGAVCAPLPSAPGVAIYKVMDKMFAILEVRRVEVVILKCDPSRAEMLRTHYAGVGHRSHLDPRFWIAVDLHADVPAEEIASLATHSYELVCAKLTRNQKTELDALSSGGWLIKKGGGSAPRPRRAGPGPNS